MLYYIGLLMHFQLGNMTNIFGVEAHPWQFSQLISSQLQIVPALSFLLLQVSDRHNIASAISDHTSEGRTIN